MEFREVCQGPDSSFSESDGSDSDDGTYVPPDTNTDTDVFGDSCVSEDSLNLSTEDPPPRGRHERHTSQSSTTEFEGFSDEGLIDLPHDINGETDFMKKWVDGDRPRQPLPFTRRVGPRLHLDIPENATPADYLTVFLRKEDYEIIAEETNRYAQQVLEQRTLTSRSRFNGWVPTVWQEIKALIAITIAMGLLVLRDLNEY